MSVLIVRVVWPTIPLGCCMVLLVNDSCGPIPWGGGANTVFGAEDWVIFRGFGGAVRSAVLFQDRRMARR